MRKIEEQLVNAIANKKNFRSGNTEYVHGTLISSVYLFGHEICRIDETTGVRKYSHCGWPTVTTASRLNALGANVRKRKVSEYETKFINADGSDFVCQF